MILQKVRLDIEELVNRGKQSLVVFDIDSTLLDISPRLQEILNRFAQNLDHQNRFPQAVKILKQVIVKRSDWGFEESLRRVGLVPEREDHKEFLKTLESFWIKSFFSNDYLPCDVAYPGAVDYVRNLHLLGANIIYLTGRSEEKMLFGTLESLRKLGFPLNGTTARAVLKPHPHLEDALFKSDWLAQLPPRKYEKIYVFENEPVNLEKIRSLHPEIELIFFESTHSGLAAPPRDLPTIMDYLTWDKKQISD